MAEVHTEIDLDEGTVQMRLKDINYDIVRDLLERVVNLPHAEYVAFMAHLRRLDRYTEA